MRSVEFGGFEDHKFDFGANSSIVINHLQTGFAIYSKDRSSHQEAFLAILKPSLEQGRP
jgi:hypothetical protein